MRAVSFGKVIVATAGTPVQLGVSTLAANMGAGDTVLTVSNAGVFSPDMLPFPLVIDTGANQETILVTAIASTKFTVTRNQAGGGLPQAHSSGVAIVANYPITGFIAGADDANVGKAYLGTKTMGTGGAAGTIKRFRVVTATSPDDTLKVMLNSQDGDPGSITDYKIDVATSSDGLNFSAWVR
jgi:hypothetical protein